MDDPDDDLYISRLYYKIRLDGRPMFKLAQLLGISRPMLSRLAHGHVEISSRTLLNMCMLWDCQPDELLGWIPISDTKVIDDILSPNNNLSEVS